MLLQRHAVVCAFALLTLSIQSCDLDRAVKPKPDDVRVADTAKSQKGPSNLTISSATERLDLSWRDNSTNESGFELYRSTAGGAYGAIATTEADITTYSDAGLLAATQYCYEVRSFTITGKQSYSAFSDVACVTTPPPPPLPPPPPPAELPMAPTELMAGAYAWRISLWWQDNSWQDGPTKEDGFRVERCEQVVCNDDDFRLIAVTPYGWNFYNDGDVVPGTTYTYRVRAFNSAGASAASNEASATACVVATDPEGYYVCADPETLAP